MRRNRPFIQKTLVQIFIDEVTRKGGAGFVYRGWFFGKYGKSKDNADFKSKLALALAHVSADEAAVVDGLRRWSHHYGERVPPEPVAFAASIVPPLSDAGRVGISRIRAILPLDCCG